MKHFFIILFCCFCPVVVLTQDAENPDYSEAIHMIEVWLDAQRDYDALPGISAAFVDDQDLIWSKGFGMANLENDINAESATIYSICSISKLFTSVAIMQLRDEGKLRLDDQVKEVLPWFDIEQKYTESGPITIRSLLTHSSGLPREADYPYWTGPEFPFPSSAKVKEKLSEQETLYPASTYFQYSNLGLTLLGEIVAAASGMDYDEYVEQHILTPLRLADTRTSLPESQWGNKLAAGYSFTKRDGSREKVPLFQAKGIAPAAGYSSTVQDLGLFASWQFRLRENGGTEILKASTLKEMQRVHWMDPDWNTSWGLGFSVYQVNGKTMVGHGGSCPGYRSTLMMDLEKKRAFIVMINAGGANPGKYASGIRAILAKVGNGIKEEKANGHNLNDYAGNYDSQPWWGERAVVPWQGKLAVFSLPSENPANEMTLLKHIEGDTFQRIRKDKTLGEKVKFERDENGKVVSMWRHSNYSKKIK